MAPLTILGTGLGGYTLAREFRKLDADTPIRMITADDGRNYSKPMLSTGFSKGKDADGLAMADAGQMAETLRLEMRTFAEVSAINPDQHQILVGTEWLDYSKLILATGAAPVQLPWANELADRVFSVNDLLDYHRFHQAIQGKKSVVIVGGGLVGCEYAHDLASAGYQVTVIAQSEHIFPELLPTEASTGLQAQLEALGITFLLQQSVTDMAARGDGVEVQLATGGLLATDLVLSAIGLRPRTQLARDAGIECNRGICTDRWLATNQQDIYALGDCAEVAGHNLLYVLPLMTQARALAKTLAGQATQVHYPPMPVAVKTPTHPVVVAPQQGDGQWILADQTGNSVKMLYKLANGQLAGYALTGSFVAEKMALNKELSPLL